MTAASSVRPPGLAAVFPAGTLAQARRLLAGGRVEELCALRSAVAGTVVAPNGRRFAAWLALDERRRLVTASCACAPKLRPGATCPHLAALLLVATAGGSGGWSPGAATPEGAALELPGERFERGPWFYAAEALAAERRGGATVRHDSPALGHPAAVRVIVDGAGTAQAVLSGPDLEGAAPGLAAVTAPGPAPAGLAALSIAERRLAELTRTPDEMVLARRGARSRRQTVEDSPWWLLAKRAFELAAAADEAETGLEVVGDRPFLVVRRGATRFALALLPQAIDQLQRVSPTALQALGLAVGTGSARPVLRLELAADGALLLEPAYLVTRDDDAAVIDRSAAEAARIGTSYLLVDGAALSVAAARRPFAEPEAGGQGRLAFDDSYRPSPLGQPLERRTRVPPADVARFLTRHSEEIGQLPAALLPPELAAGGPAEPDDAELVVGGLEGDRFRLDLDYRIGERWVSGAAILAARREGVPLLIQHGVLVDPSHPRFAWMDALGPDAIADGEGRSSLRLGGLDVCRLRSYLPAGHRLVAEAPADDARDEGAAAAAEVLDRLAELSPDAPPPAAESLGIPLFDFQESGYAWLWFLWRNGFGGLLCDDMGLGKTYQAIALMAAVAVSEGRFPRVVVVCPASVLPHWEEKLRTLAPALPLCRHHGASRQASPAVAPGILLTTYGTLRNDAAAFAGEPFDLFVLDEAQTIKNRQSATHQALRSLRARMALGLTGTPIENRVEELRTLLEFVLPGYLPGAGSFDRAFGQPIAAGDQAARARLARLVRPFVLRRTKEQVLDSLPPKLDDPRRCVLVPEQRWLHDRLLATRGAALRELLASRAPVPYLHVFALLSKLKQLCNHPDLLRPAGAPPSGLGSGKWELFSEVLDEALGSGLKVVVFSQYLRMLDLIAAHLVAYGVGYETLRGSTRDRARPVARFRDDPDCRVFLASLKAAGVGIDLTAASVVIHYDRWWNRAREDQATDRVHRIGQSRGVQVITLTCEGTVEERIAELIEEKGRLASDVLPVDEGPLLRRFSREEMRALLASPGLPG